MADMKVGFYMLCLTRQKLLNGILDIMPYETVGFGWDSTFHFREDRFLLGFYIFWMGFYV